MSYNPELMNGTIARLKTEKGFGFIKPDGGGEDRFFHMSAIGSDGPRFDELREGQRVEFEPEDGPKGPRATAVRLV